MNELDIAQIAVDLHAEGLSKGEKVVLLEHGDGCWAVEPVGRAIDGAFRLVGEDDVEPVPA
jgi:hypothetical protein